MRFVVDGAPQYKPIQGHFKHVCEILCSAASKLFREWLRLQQHRDLIRVYRQKHVLGRISDAPRSRTTLWYKPRNCTRFHCPEAKQKELSPCNPTTCSMQQLLAMAKDPQHSRLSSLKRTAPYRRYLKPGFLQVGTTPRRDWCGRMRRVSMCSSFCFPTGGYRTSLGPTRLEG